MISFSGMKDDYEGKRTFIFKHLEFLYEFLRERDFKIEL